MFMSLFNGLFRSRDKPQNRTAGSSYSFFFGGEYGGLELTAEAARFYTSGRARFTPPGGHILQ